MLALAAGAVHPAWEAGRNVWICRKRDEGPPGGVGIIAGAALGALMHNMIVGICIGVGVCVAWERRSHRKPTI